MFGAIVGSTLTVDTLAAILAGVFLFALDRVAHAVKSAVQEWQAEQAKVEREGDEEHAFMHGIAGAPGAIKLLPDVMRRLAVVEQEQTETGRLIKRELGNGGNSTADKVRRLETQTARIESKVDTVVDLMGHLVEGRASGQG